MKFLAGRRASAVVLTLGLVCSSLPIAPMSASAQESPPAGEGDRRQDPVPVEDRTGDSVFAAPAEDGVVPAPDWSYPTAGVFDAVVPTSGDVVRVGQSPISLRSDDADSAGRSVEFEILEQSLADRVGARGLLFRLTDRATESRETGDDVDTTPDVVEEPLEEDEPVDVPASSTSTSTTTSTTIPTASSTTSLPESSSSTTTPDESDDGESSPTSSVPGDEGAPSPTTSTTLPVGPDDVEAPGKPVPGVGEPVPLTFEIDYRSIAGRFGSSFVDRLQLIAVPDCALEIKVAASCDTRGVQIDTVNDRTRGVLVARYEPSKVAFDSSSMDTPVGAAEPPDRAPSTSTSTSTTSTSTTAPPTPERSSSAGSDSEASAAAPASGGGMTMMMTSGSSGQEGSFASTPLSASASWQVGLGSGGFSWSYPVPAQPGPGGGAPAVELGYSSGSIDGMVGGENNQSGPAGMGWGLTESFIERRYTGCRADGQGWDDLCWKSDNAQIVLNGVSTSLVGGPTSWRAKDNPNWTISRATGASNGDNDGEHWVVTTPDGTKYFFGLGVHAERSAATSSTWIVPVFGNQSGEPCNGGTNWCHQAWRWNLDRVEDPNGNVSMYFYERETNSYGMNGSPSAVQTYTRGGGLDRIEYGLRKNGGSTPAPARIKVTREYRCNLLSPACGAPSSSNGSSFPDVPNDLICTTSCPGNYTPTFFTGRRITLVTAQQFNTAVYTDVDRVQLNHDWITNGEDANGDGINDQRLWLRYLTRIGLSEASPAQLPTIRFDSDSLLDNRVDYNVSAGVLPLKHPRLDKITTEHGSRILVDYGQPHPCNAVPPAAGWDENGQDCFPRYWSPPAGASGFGIFHRYLVESVTVDDLVGGQPDLVTSYLYQDAPAWHYDDDPIASSATQSWSDWRGHSRVRVTKGVGPTAQQSRTEYRLFRGMHGDRLSPSGSKSVSVSTFAGTANYTDSNWLRGRIVDERQVNSAGIEITGASYEYLDRYNASPNGVAHFVAESKRTNRTRHGAATYLRTITTSYASTINLPSQIVDTGYTHVAGDERCTQIDYAANTSTWMIDYPSRVRLRGPGCANGVLRDTKTSYDGAGWGTAPTKGNVTRTESLTSGSTYAATTASHDAYGRVTTATDPNNHTTQTVFSPPSGYANTATVTNPKGHTTETRFHSERHDLPNRTTDANGNRTYLTYDGLGRVVQVWQPTESYPNGPASYTFQYTLSENSIGYGAAGPARVKSSRLQTEGATQEATHSVQYLDGNLRPLQTQVQSPVAGKSIVAATGYDSRGLVASESVPQDVPHTFGSGVASWGTPKNRTVYGYDELERTRTATFYTDASPTHTTTTYYTGTTEVLVDPPVGGNRRQVSDVHGNLIEVADQLAGPTWATAYYRYDAADQLTDIYDPDDNHISYGYDESGRRTAMDDPDAGTWSYEYDLAGNQILSTDANGATIWTGYDDLNRPIARRQTNSTGTELASWTYDAPGEAGLLNLSTRHDTTGDHVIDIDGYDARNRPTGKTYTIPAGAGAIAGSYTVGYHYDEADNLVAVDYPAIGGLAAETVTTDYNALGYTATLTGDGTYSNDDYLSNAVHDGRGRPDTRTLGAGTWAVTRDYDYDSQQRLTRHQATTNGGATLVQDDRIVLDNIGNVTERHDARPSVDQRECFGYDGLNRLVDARTVAASTGSCSTGTANTGPNPYDHDYAYHLDGRIDSRTENGTTIDYDYPADTANVTALVGDWDGNGTDTPGLYSLDTHTVAARNTFTDGPPDWTATAPTPQNNHVPIVGDWDGNGTDTLGWYRSDGNGANANVYLTNDNNTITISFKFGLDSDEPIIGDWDGNGTDTIGVFRPSTREFFARNSLNGGAAQLSATFGASGDNPVVGDWDGNGTDTIGVYRYSNHTFYGRNSFSSGPSNVTAAYGAGGDEHLQGGDWNGNGTDGIGVHRPSTDEWHLRNHFSSGSSNVTATFTSVELTRPHAVTSVGTNSYTYDDNGNLTGRPGANAQQDLDWDPEHRLESVTDGADTTSFVYDPDGQRITRTTPTDTTLYIDGHELTATSTGLEAKRYYNVDGITLAVRDTATSTLNWLLGDHLGSTSITVNATTGATTEQRYLPYGAERSSTGSNPTERGWIGQTHDDSTGLQYLNARYYDPNIGRFSATDPLADFGQPITIDAYGYSGASPLSYSDPSGLLRDCECGTTGPPAPVKSQDPAGCGHPGFIGPCASPSPSGARQSSHGPRLVSSRPDQITVCAADAACMTSADATMFNAAMFPSFADEDGVIVLGTSRAEGAPSYSEGLIPIPIVRPRAAQFGMLYIGWTSESFKYVGSGFLVTGESESLQIQSVRYESTSKSLGVSVGYESTTPGPSPTLDASPGTSYRVVSYEGYREVFSPNLNVFVRGSDYVYVDNL